MEEDSKTVKTLRIIGLFGVVILMLCLLYESALSHQPMGHIQGTGYQYLYGMKIGGLKDLINCCLYKTEGGILGDCKLVLEKDVKQTSEGIVFADGELVKNEDITVSPDENYYRCKSPETPSHCAFAPPQGF